MHKFIVRDELPQSSVFELSNSKLSIVFAELLLKMLDVGVGVVFNDEFSLLNGPRSLFTIPLFLPNKTS